MSEWMHTMISVDSQAGITLRALTLSLPVVMCLSVLFLFKNSLRERLIKLPQNAAFWERKKKKEKKSKGVPKCCFGGKRLSCPEMLLQFENFVPRKKLEFKQTVLQHSISRWKTLCLWRHNYDGLRAVKGLKELALLKHVLSYRKRRSNGVFCGFFQLIKKEKRRRTRTHTRTHARTHK